MLVESLGIGCGPVMEAVGGNTGGLSPLGLLVLNALSYT